MTTQEMHQPTTDYRLFRLSATLLFAGEFLSIVVGIFHPSHENANDHAAAFAEYATSKYWTAIHFGQFVGMAIIIAGLLTLFLAFNIRSGMAGWAGRIGTVMAGISLGLYGILQAVDGVALKQAVDAWVKAPDAEKAARFASAEVIRWLEWGSRSYQSFMLGLSFILFAIMVISLGRTPRLLGYVMGLSGLAYIMQGFVLGSEGFSASNSVPQLMGYILVVVWSIWLLIIAWRMKGSVDAIQQVPETNALAAPQ